LVTYSSISSWLFNIVKCFWGSKWEPTGSERGLERENPLQIEKKGEKNWLYSLSSACAWLSISFLLSIISCLDDPLFTGWQPNWELSTSRAVSSSSSWTIESYILSRTLVLRTLKRRRTKRSSSEEDHSQKPDIQAIAIVSNKGRSGKGSLWANRTEK
jgi:hypothetical protein